MRKWSAVLIALPIGVYVLYVVAIAALLNTSLFAALTDMTDSGETHLRFENATSFIPGKIRVGKLRVLVREPDVELDVDLEGAVVNLDLRALTEKRVRVISLRVDETTVAIRKKVPPPEVEKVGSVAEHERAALAEERRRLANRWTIEVERVELPNIPSIRLEKKELRGKMAIAGAFMLQPGTRAEVYPSRFTVADGNWNDEVTGIQLTSEARIHRFHKARVSGSEVFRYLDARVEGTAKASGLELLNVTLRSLGDYGFGSGEANLAGALEIRKGKIQRGSAIRAERSTIRVSAPSFEFSGKGHLEWKAGSDDSSALHAEISEAKTDVRLGGNRIHGTIKKVVADARILGLDLTSAFTGLSGRLRLVDGRLASGPMAEGTEKFRYQFKARLGGEITAVAGDYPDNEAAPKPSVFTVEIVESKFALPKLGTIEGLGRVAFTVRPVDFRDGRAEFPRLRIDYRGELDGKYPLALAWVSTRANRVFATKKSKVERWEGNGRMKIEDFNGVLSYLSDTDRISGLVRVGLHATEVRGSLDWTISPRETRVTVHDLDSNGIWSGAGTLISEKSPDGSAFETRARFEGKILGFPVGVGVEGSEVDVKLLSGGKPPSDTKRP